MEGEGYAGITMFPRHFNRPKPRLKKRRSERLVLSVPVVVHRLPEEGPPFSEGAHTLVVNAHGALINLEANVVPRQRVILQNALSGEQQICRVVFTEKKVTGPTKVAIEFQWPAPEFWRIAFPPADWNPVG
jgi:hypothetical protein